MASSKQRLARLRELMHQRDLAAYLIPSTDEHHSEYVPEGARRLRWLSGFTGSAGTILVTASEAFLWTDGRYHLQASRELDPREFTLMRMGVPDVPELEEVVCTKVKAGQKVGLDPKLFSIQEFTKLKGRLELFGIELFPLEENLVDLLWEKRPPLPEGCIWHLDESFAGMEVVEKLRLVREELGRRGGGVLVLGALDEIAWLLNLRGSDVPYNPVFQGYVLLTQEEALLFVETTKLTPEARRKLSPWVKIQPYQDMGKFLVKLAAKRGRVMADPANTSQWVKELSQKGARVIEHPSPVAFLKAVKNPVERAGMAACHQRDGLAMVRFLRWLEEQVPRARITETQAARHLDQLRASLDYYAGPSFETIVAYGPNGAVIHYRPSPETDLELRPKGILLVDSGAHYLDGTTDVTRTVALGRPTALEKERFTRVLKGHILLAQMRFPRGTTGKQLDALARTYLWEVGLDYRHGTGHGIGCYLNVHEGPQSISPKDTGVPLLEGMFVSNEPGYYQEGAFGIRIENVMMVEKEQELETDYGPFLRFKTVTMVPLDRKLINPKLLNPRERAWLNQYHQEVKKALLAELEPEEADWLEKATSPL
jgi:Xaa-Pro aminopeptidase